jgi:hypothetical protein
LVALALFAQLALARLALRADLSRAFFLGDPIDLRCAARARFGFPCPTCGVTRGTGLALHGEWGAAFHLFPAAPLAILGVLVASVAFAVLAWLEKRRDPRRAAFRAALRSSLLFFAVALATVWLGDWALRVSGLRVA